MTNGMTEERLAEIKEDIERLERYPSYRCGRWTVYLAELLTEVERLREENRQLTLWRYHVLSIYPYTGGLKIEK